MAKVCTPEQQPALLRPVGDETGAGADEQHRPELRRRQQTEGDAAVRQLQHQKRLRDQRQPVADLGDELAAEEEAEVADPQGVEGLAAHAPETGHGGPPRPGRRGRRAPPRRRGRRNRGPRMRPVSQAVLRWRDSSSRARPAAVRATRTKRRSPGSTARATSPIDFELGHHLGDRGRRHLLVLGQRPEGERSLPLDDRERGQLAGREPGVGLLAQPAGEAGGAEPQPRRQLLVGLRGRRSGRGAGRRGHAPYFTNLISLPNHHRDGLAAECAPHAPLVARSASQFATGSGRLLGEPDADAQTRSTAAPANWAL